MQYQVILATCLAAFLAITSASPTPPPDEACTITTSVDGNGSPVQNGLHKQVSEPIACASKSSCSVSQLTTYTVGYTVSGTLAQWIGAGFSVEESFTTGNTYTCNGNAGDTVCVWVNLAHTAYQVRNYYAGQCPSNHGYGPDMTLKSPNKNNAGGEYYCVTGSKCGTNGQSYWDTTAA